MLFRSEVDISGSEAKADWIELDIRPQFSFKLNYDGFSKSMDEIIEKINKFERHPILELKIQGDEIESDLVQAQISRLKELSLRCFWRIVSKDSSNSSVFLDRPSVIDDELLKLSVNALGSEQLASFAVKELLPMLDSDKLKDAIQVVMEDFENFKKEKKK